MLVAYQPETGPVAIATYSNEAAIAKIVPQGLPYVLLNESDLPSDRGNRSLWRLSGDGKIVVQVSAKSVEAAKLEQLEAIAVLFEEKTATIDWGGHTYQTDATAKERFAAEEQAIARGDRPDPSPWRTLSNQLVTLSNANIQALVSAIYLRHRQAIFASFTHKDAIAAMTTVAEVEAYDVSQGWTE